MAEVQVNARKALDTTYGTSVYECPAATKAIVLNAQCANVDGTASVDVSAQWLDSSAANAATRLVELVAVPAKAAQNLLAGPIFLEPGDVFQAKASAAGDAELTLAIVEITA